MLRQALINLVDNAIKYSPAGTDILVRAVDEAAREHVMLEVCDRGPGIAPERSARIFERCYRISAGGDSRGAGLGLSISKWAVEAHHGRLTCERREGGGSVFRIALPRHATTEPYAAAG
jgi:signal transduction histidine kinase